MNSPAFAFPSSFLQQLLIVQFLFRPRAGQHAALAKVSILPTSALKPADVARVPLEDLKLMARHRVWTSRAIFKDAEIKTYLEAQDWFKSNPDFNNSMLNATENHNLDLIRDAEGPTSIRPCNLATCATGARGR